MKKFYILSTLIFAALASQAMAAVPNLDTKGVGAVTFCPTSTTGAVVPAIAYHSDKIVFAITDKLQAANTADQAKLDALPRNTELDVKLRDDPKLVADLKSKVLTFLGAALTVLNSQAISIISVDYAIAVCPKSP